MFDNQVWFVDDAVYHPSTKGEWVGKRSYGNKLVGLNVSTQAVILGMNQALECLGSF